MWNRSSTYQRFYSSFQRKISSQKKRKSRIKSKKLPPSLPRIWVYTKHVISLKELSRLQSLHFPLKEYMDRYFWLSLDEQFCRLFSQSFFQRENTPRKNPTETQSMKIQVKSGEIPVRKKVGKIMQKVSSRRLTLKSTELLLANTQNSIIINKGKDLKISKNRFNRYGGQVRSSTSKKIYISTVWVVGKFGTEQLGCRTSLFQYFRSSKFSDK